MFKNWTKGDLIFYSASIILIIVSGIIFKAYWISFLVSIIGITAGILNIKLISTAMSFILLRLYCMHMFPGVTDLLAKLF
jgi:hypothetical protein